MTVMLKRRLAVVAAILVTAGVLAFTVTRAAARSGTAMPTWVATQSGWEAQQHNNSSASLVPVTGQ